MENQKGAKVKKEVKRLQETTTETQEQTTKEKLLSVPNIPTLHNWIYHQVVKITVQIEVLTLKYKPQCQLPKNQIEQVHSIHYEEMKKSNANC